MKTFLGNVVCLMALLLLPPESMAQAQAIRIRPSARTNKQAISQLGKALIMYSMDNGETFPDKLDARLDAYGGGNEALLWRDPETGKKLPFLYRPGLTPASGADMMVAASPVAVNGAREVLHVDGSVTTLEEAEFLKQAAAQKWEIAAPIKKEDVEAALKAEIEAQIKKLGDADSKARAAARSRLKEIGAPAAPFLEEQLKNADQEIRMAAKELLGRQ